MRQSFDQIGAAIPFRSLRAVRLICPAPQEQQFPARDNKALIERKRQLVRRHRRVHRRAGHQIRIKRIIVLVGDVGEMIIGKGRIKMLPFPVDAGAHRAAERGLRPCADAGVGVGRNIRRIDRAERRRHRQATRKGLAAAHRVAIVAITERGQIAAPLDQRRVEGLWRGRLNRCYRRSPGDRKRRDPTADQERRHNACYYSCPGHSSLQLFEGC